MKRNILLLLVVLLSVIAGVQTAMAQKIVLYKTNSQTIECEISELDSIVFIAGPKIVTSIVLSETSITLQPDETMRLTATIKPSDAENPELTWESSDEEVAMVVNNGLVLAIADGTCIITCRATDGSGVYAECAVKVRTIINNNAKKCSVFHTNKIITEIFSN